MQARKKGSQHLTKGAWKPVSNLHPLSKSRKQKGKSTFSQQNPLLEKSPFNEQNEESIGDSQVSFEHPQQIKEKGKALQKHAERKVSQKDEEINSRSNRFCKMESPKPLAKPVNEIFGSLEDFLKFLSYRSRKIFDFAKRFKEIEDSNNVDGLNGEICPKIKYCIIQESIKLSPDKPKLSAIQKKIQMKKITSQEKLI